MDKIKPYLIQLKKYHFWVLLVVVLGCALFAWRSGTSTLAEQFAANSGQIQGAFSQISGVRANNPHPNDRFIAEKKEATEKLKEEVAKAWQLHLQRQAAVFVWPADVLGQSFADEASKVGPEGTFSDEFLYRYQQEAKNIPLSWVKKFDLRRAEVVPSTQDPPAADPKKVEQLSVLRGVMVFNGVQALSSKFSYDRRPNSKQVRIAQEDFWLYEVMLEAITKVNVEAGATEHYQAPIKELLSIVIAQAAVEPPKVELPYAKAASSASRAADRGAEIVVPTPADDGAMLVANRYIDPATMKPIPAPTGKEQYVLMPVRFEVLMDQRRIPELLVSCANAPLLFKTEFVSFRDLDGGATGEGGNRAGQGGGATSSGSSGGGRSSGSGKSGSGASQVSSETGPFDASVTVWGYLHLFNPPDPSLLPQNESAPGSEPAEPAVAGQP